MMCMLVISCAPGSAPPSMPCPEYRPNSAQIVNADEVKVLDQMQVPFYGINVNVGVSLALPGFRSDIASGLLDKLPYGVASLVGIRSIDEGRRARAAGAGCLLVKESMLQEAGSKGLRHLLQELLYATSGDD